MAAGVGGDLDPIERNGAGRAQSGFLTEQQGLEEELAEGGEGVVAGAPTSGDGGDEPGQMILGHPIVEGGREKLSLIRVISTEPQTP